MSNDKKTESRLAAMRSGRKRSEPTHSKVLECDIVWQVLNRQEELEATAAAVQLFEKAGIPNDLHAYKDLDETVRTEILARAMRHADMPDVAFASSGAEIRQLLGEDEVEQLFAQYQDARDLLLPDPFALPEDERRLIDAALKKKDKRVLESFGSCSLTSYLLSLADQSSS